MTNQGVPICYGIMDLDPVRHLLPPGARVRMRWGKAVKVFVRDGDSATQFVIGKENLQGDWRLIPQGRNAVVRGSVAVTNQSPKGRG